MDLPASPDLSLHWQRFVSESQHTPHNSQSIAAVEPSPQKLILLSSQQEQEEEDDERGSVPLFSMLQHTRTRRQEALHKKQRRLEFSLQDTIAKRHEFVGADDDDKVSQDVAVVVAGSVDADGAKALQATFLQFAETQEEEEEEARATVTEAAIADACITSSSVEEAVRATVAVVVEAVSVAMSPEQQEVAPTITAREDTPAAVIAAVTTTAEAIVTPTSQEDPLIAVIAAFTTTAEEVVAKEVPPLFVAPSEEEEPIVVFAASEELALVPASINTPELQEDNDDDEMTRIAEALEENEKQQSNDRSITPAKLCFSASAEDSTPARTILTSPSLPPPTTTTSTTSTTSTTPKQRAPPFMHKRFAFYDDVQSTSFSSTTTPVLLRPAPTLRTLRPLPTTQAKPPGVYRAPRPMPSPVAAAAATAPIKLPAHLQQSVDQAKQVLHDTTVTPVPKQQQQQPRQLHVAPRQTGRMYATADMFGPPLKEWGDSSPPPPPPPPPPPAQPEMMQTPLPTVPSMFSTGSNRTISISKAALSKASAAACEEEPAKPVTSTFSTAGNKSNVLSQAALAKAQSALTCEDESTATRTTLQSMFSTARTDKPIQLAKSLVERAEIGFAQPALESKPPPPKPFRAPAPLPAPVAPPPIQQTSLPPPQKRSKPTTKRTSLPPLRVPISSLSTNSSSITSKNAICLSFAICHNDAMLSDSPCMWTLEILRTRLVGQPTLAWVANHFRWIVWKLASQDRISIATQDVKRLTFNNVLAQLEHRQQVESEEKHSFLYQILTRKCSLPGTVCVFMLSNLSQVKVNGLLSGELSDGWYAVECLLDEHLTSLAEQGKLYIGQKLVVANSLALADFDAHFTSPLELSCNNVLQRSSAAVKQPKLLLGANSSKPCAWDAKLGLRPRNTPVTKLLDSIRPSAHQFGVNVPRIRIVIARMSSMLFREEMSYGKHVVRTQAENDAEDAVNSQRKVIPFLRLTVGDVSTGKQLTLTVWSPNDTLVDMLEEGKVFEVCNLAIAKQLPEIRLNAGQQTQWYDMGHIAMQHSKAFTPRFVVQSIDQTVENQMADFVLAWVYRSSTQKYGYAVLVNDNSTDQMVCITFGNKQNSLFQSIPMGMVLCARDLFVKGMDKKTGVLHLSVADVSTFPVAVSAEQPGFAHFCKPLQLAQDLWDEDSDMKLALAQAKARALEPVTAPQQQPIQSCVIRLPIAHQALTNIIVGKKEVEARRFKGEVLGVKPGSTVKFVCGVYLSQEVLVTQIQVYPTYRMLLEAEEFCKVCPNARTFADALEELERGNNDSTIGEVVAISFQVKDVFQTDQKLVLQGTPRTLKI